MDKICILSLLLSSVTAVPAPQAGSGVFYTPTCNDNYTVTNQQNIEGPPQTGDYTVGGGGQLTAGSSFSTGVTITAGGGISITKIAGLDLSASVAVTTTKTVSQGAGASCPQGPWQCALAIYPELLEVSGEKWSQVPQGNGCSNTGQPTAYDVTYPVEGDSGAVKSRVEVCACTNFDHSDDDGAPSIKCGGCA